MNMLQSRDKLLYEFEVFGPAHGKPLREVLFEGQTRTVLHLDHDVKGDKRFAILHKIENVSLVC